MPKFCLWVLSVEGTHCCSTDAPVWATSKHVRGRTADRPYLPYLTTPHQKTLRPAFSLWWCLHCSRGSSQHPESSMCPHTVLGYALSGGLSWGVGFPIRNIPNSCWYMAQTETFGMLDRASWSFTQCWGLTLVRLYHVLAALQHDLYNQWTASTSLDYWSN